MPHGCAKAQQQHRARAGGNAKHTHTHTHKEKVRCTRCCFPLRSDGGAIPALPFVSTFADTPFGRIFKFGVYAKTIPGGLPLCSVNQITRIPWFGKGKGRTAQCTDTPNREISYSKRSRDLWFIPFCFPVFFFFSRYRLGCVLGHHRPGNDASGERYFMFWLDNIEIHHTGGEYDMPAHSNVVTFLGHRKDLKCVVERQNKRLLEKKIV